MPAYANDRAWSDQFIPAIKGIVGPLLLEPADFRRDATEATDLIVLVARDMRVAARVRRHGYADRYPWQFTIRARRDTGATTELSKIVAGWGDWFFYGHASADGRAIDRWMVIDLQAVRAGLIRRHDAKCTIKSGDKANGDGTYFKWFDARSFPAHPPLLVASSHSIVDALESAA